MGAKQLDPDYAGEDFTDRQARSVKGVDVLTLSDRPVSLSDAMRACIDDALTARGKLPTRKPAEGEAPFDPWAEVDAVWDLSDDDAAAREAETTGGSEDDPPHLQPVWLVRGRL